MVPSLPACSKDKKNICKMFRMQLAFLEAVVERSGVDAFTMEIAPPVHVICVRSPTCILRFASQCGAVGSAIATGHAIGIDTSHACVSCVGRHRRKSQDRAQRARRAAEPFPIDYSAPQHTYNPHFDSLSVQSILTFSNRYETQLLRQESNQESEHAVSERKIKKLK